MNDPATLKSRTHPPSARSASSRIPKLSTLTHLETNFDSPKPQTQLQWIPQLPRFPKALTPTEVCIFSKRSSFLTCANILTGQNGYGCTVQKHGGQNGYGCTVQKNGGQNGYGCTVQ